LKLSEGASYDWALNNRDAQLHANLPAITALNLWPHQLEAVRASDRYFNAGIDRSALMHMPTGTGKTGVMATIAARRSINAPVLIVCPSAALVKQLQSEIQTDFWSRIGAHLQWAPEQVIQLLPSLVDDLLKSLTSADVGRRTVVIGTIQALGDIYRDPKSPTHNVLGC
jgi:superfamily II DNA or RNA helicase